MNLAIEVNLFVPEEDWGPEEIARLSLGISDKVLELGYGNVAADDVDDTRLLSVIVVRPVKSKGWIQRAKEAMAVNFPTSDERFIFQADNGGIKEIEDG